MIISASRLGLCNRLKSVVSCMRLGRRTGEEVRIYWEPLAGSLNCRFSDLFSNDLEISPPFPPASKPINSWRLAVFPEDDIPAGFDREQPACPVPFLEEGGDGRYIDFAYQRIPRELQSVYSELFAELQVTPEIAGRVEEFAQRFKEDTVSVQIRAWIDDSMRQRALFEINNFTREMNRFPVDTGFFLSTDSDRVENYLLDRYPGRVMVYERSTNRRDSRFVEAGVRDDLVDLLLLAKNKQLIGTYISTFSEVAWWLGGCRADVVIV